MSNNAKNQLLEFCQKQRLDYPRYETFSQTVGVTLLWTSICKFQNMATKSGQHRTKTAAEIESSQKMLENLDDFDIWPTLDTTLEPVRPCERPISQPIVQQEMKEPFEKKVIVVIDAENLPIEIKQKNLPIVYHVFYGYLAKLQAQMEQSYQKFATVHKHKIPLDEATDHLITFTLSQMLINCQIQPKLHIVLICSRDKSAAIQVELLKLHNIEVYHITSKQEFESQLNLVFKI